MEKLRSLKIYKILLDIAWFSIIIVFGLYFVVNLIRIIFFKEFHGLSFNAFPLKFELSNFDFRTFKNAYLFSEIDTATVSFKLSKIKLAKLADPFVIWYIFTGLISLLIALYQLKLFREFISDVINRKIFTELNVKRLRLIGIIELSLIPIGVLVYLVFTYFFNNQTIVDSRLTFSPDYWRLFEELMPGLEYLIFAGVFSFGLKLKQEQDLTI